MNFKKENQGKEKKKIINLTSKFPYQKKGKVDSSGMNAVCLRFKLFSNRSVYVMGIEFISGRLLKHRSRGWLKHC